MYLPTKDTLLKGSANDLFDEVYAIFFLIFFMKAYIVGTQQVDAIQMGTYNICLYTEVDKKYSGSNLKTMELLDCALIGICAVIRANTVLCGSYHCLHQRILLISQNICFVEKIVKKKIQIYSAFPLRTES